MNFLSGSEDADGKKCFYCNKVFENHRALIGHLRVHQENGSSVDLNFPGQPSKFINVNRNHPVPPLNIQQNLAGANSPTSNARALPTIDFCTLFRSNKANQAGRKRSTGGNLRFPQTQIFMSSFVLALPCNNLAPRAFVPAGASAAMSSAVFVPSGSVVTTGLPTGSSSYLVPNGVCQFNTGEFQIIQDGLLPTSRDALKRTQGHPPFSGVEKGGQSERSLSTGKRSKRSSIAGNTLNANEETRIPHDVQVEPESLQLRELPLLDNFVELTSAAKTDVGTEEEECPANLDPSLQL
ncbi:uncharacterized protein LOC120210352 isoform X2 [Hibiscus syriacus]|uniref:uncharacterized protein LOC120210352 isoform X2 n=1 Tax=Hibiscus syriacus TaxID=106335 RepID=UPI0019216C52|nr:uncharacterized protein LOC120210352 isoform X2 [Hibiscus syriacus]